MLGWGGTPAGGPGGVGALDPAGVPILGREWDPGRSQVLGVGRTTTPSVTTTTTHHRVSVDLCDPRMGSDRRVRAATSGVRCEADLGVYCVVRCHQQSSGLISLLCVGARVRQRGGSNWRRTGRQQRRGCGLRRAGLRGTGQAQVRPTGDDGAGVAQEVPGSRVVRSSRVPRRVSWVQSTVLPVTDSEMP
jgi:hypothetical protein